MAPPSIPNEFSVFGRESMRSDERADRAVSLAKSHAIFYGFRRLQNARRVATPLLLNDRFQPVKSASFRDNGKNCIR